MFSSLFSRKTQARVILILLFSLMTAVLQAETAASGRWSSPASRAGAPGAEQVNNPLDPLTADEIAAAVDVLRSAGKVNDATRMPFVSLQAPDKQWVLEKWRPGMRIPRKAFVVVKQGTQTFEAVVDVQRRKLESWQEKPGVQAPILLEETFAVQEVVLSSPEFLAALAKRGITDTSGTNLLCAPLSVGYFNVPEEEGRRLLRVPCFYTEGSYTNLFARPIEGLFALVDLNTYEIVKIVDTGVRPIPEATGEYTPEAIGGLRAPLKPVKFSQPEGSNITIDGHTISWDRWRFHQRLDKRDGLILSQVKYQDGDTARSILYEASLSDVFVPYQDPDVGFYWRTFMDSGEYGFGLFATPLAPGVDCPETATFLSAIVTGDAADVFPMDNVICVFERPTGDPAWRHFEFFTGAYEGRTANELVMRMIATIGNYDYVLDYVFTQDGRIRFRVGATGLDHPQGAHSTSMEDATAAEETVYGTLASPNLVYPNHDHYFNFRLDLDVDGSQNSFELTRLVPEDVQGVPRKSVWVPVEEILETESEARLDYDLAAPSFWEVVNEQKHSELGHHPGYTLVPLDSAAQNIMDPADWPVRRAAFINHNLWVTPYDPDERNAGGFYTNQSKGDDGLAVWSEQNRSIVDTDIVLWYNVGLHHEPHTEDFPIMPTRWLEFELVPHNFFSRNPALDLAK